MATTQSIIPLKEQPMGRVDLERFFRMVKRPPEGEDGCWLWQGGATGKGYGRFRLAGKLHSPHRLSYQQFVGPIPEGHYVCHRCDVGACVNPAHLFAGTNSDNMKDCAAKGRMAVQRPEWCDTVADLTAANVDEVNSLLARGMSLRRVAQHFNVNHKSVTNLIKRYGLHNPRARRLA